ncbi:CS1 type fimbrial major subunit [Rheinheimera sp. A13L]|uniref:CS1 type fimbrial major subunit n=1 Tax=Rheinheimera sp. A13L TaxID=506534 RepID=UPI0002124DDE|nr:CS1 type fimbrial major subunit [Rheinheimera sp. A13L]EGM76178.1 CS1 type fimbrial major subunit [Rheinheimera sp. A13L]
MKKALLIATSLFIAGQAAATESRTVDIIADVPSDTFYVVEAPGSDIFSATQTMNYDVANQTFAPVMGDIVFQASAGSITAQVTGTPSLVGNTPTNTIPLTVQIGTVALSGTAEEIAPTSSAGVPTTASLRISANTGGTAPAADSYSGTVSLVFENVTP